MNLKNGNYNSFETKKLPVQRKAQFQFPFAFRADYSFFKTQFYQKENSFS